MKIKKFNESYDENSNRLDIDTLLDILLEITDEIECEVVLCSANGYCTLISQDFNENFKDIFKFLLNGRGWSFRVNYPVNSFHLYAKIISVLDPLIQRINDMGWTVNEFGNSKGFLDTEVLLNSIHFTFKPQ